MPFCFYKQYLQWYCYPDLILPTKKILRNSCKIIIILKISSDFQNVFLSKYSEENFQKSVQPATPKYFVWNFSDFLKKLVSSKFLDFCQKITQIFDNRIKPRTFSSCLSNIRYRTSLVKMMLLTTLFFQEKVFVMIWNWFIQKVISNFENSKRQWP